jgi:hypothetical protein
MAGDRRFMVTSKALPVDLNWTAGGLELVGLDEVPVELPSD